MKVEQVFGVHSDVEPARVRLEGALGQSVLITMFNGGFCIESGDICGRLSIEIVTNATFVVYSKVK